MIWIKKSQVPPGKQVIKSTWVFRRKRQPNGEIYKLKARFVVRGDLQGLDDTQNMEYSAFAIRRYCCKKTAK
jgi:hypothetical protein